MKAFKCCRQDCKLKGVRVEKKEALEFSLRCQGCASKLCDCRYKDSDRYKARYPETLERLGLVKPTSLISRCEEVLL